MQITRHLPVVAALTILGIAGTAYGGPPFVTDDPEPVDYQHWEFYVASQDSKLGGDWSGTGPHFELNYGVAPNVQLHMIAPLAYDAPPDGSSHYGYGDTEIGVKYRFIQETNYLPQVGVFPLLELPTGSESDNLGNGHLQAFLPVWLQKSWGSWTAYGGGGYGINSFSGNKIGNLWARCCKNRFCPTLPLARRCIIKRPTRPTFPMSARVQLGTVIDLSEQHHLLFSAGSSIDGPVNFQCYIAYQFTFDNSLFHFWNHSHN